MISNFPRWECLSKAGYIVMEEKIEDKGIDMDLKDTHMTPPLHPTPSTFPTKVHGDPMPPFLPWINQKATLGLFLFLKKRNLCDYLFVRRILLIDLSRI